MLTAIHNIQKHIATIVVGLLSLLPVMSQTDDIDMSFLKNGETVEVSATHFNVLRIVNHSTKPISGELTFHAPIYWHIISFPEIKTTVPAQDTLLFPIRVAVPENAIGNITYMLNANFKTSTTIYKQSTTLMVPAKTCWEMRTVNTDHVFVTSNNPNTDIQIKLSNTGNTHEIIKVEYQIGALLLFNGQTQDDFVEYIELPAQHDTILSHPVVYRRKLSYVELERYQYNWRASCIQIRATAKGETQSTYMQVRDIQSHYTNTRRSSAAPLNFEYTANNLLSGRDVSNQLRVYGTVDMPKRKVQYNVGFANVYFKDNSRFDYNRDIRYDIIYSDKRNTVHVGYNLSNKNLHPMNGRGVIGNFILNPLHNFDYAIIQNPYQNNLGGTVGYNTRFGKVNFNTSATYDANLLGNYWATSLQVGSSLTFCKYHHISATFLGSLINYTQTATDKLHFGFSAALGYSYLGKKVQVQLNGTSSLGNYLISSGMQHIHLNVRYDIIDPLSLIFYGSSQYYSTLRYPNAFGKPHNYDGNNNARLTLHYQITPITALQAGPSYTNTMRQMESNGYSALYNIHQPGVWISLSQKLGNYYTLSPNVTLGNMSLVYHSENPEENDYTWTKGFYYSVGLNLYSEHWKVNAYYTNGSTGDIYRSIAISGTPTNSSSIQIRPTYETKVLNRQGRISAYINYAYYIESERQTITYNLQYTHSFKHDWEAYASGYVFSNSRTDDTDTRTVTRNLNLVIGVRKAFNCIQQPHIKYYDFNAILFNDLDGDRQKSDDEPPVSNVLVNIKKDYSVSKERSYMPEVELITNEHGEISVNNMPGDSYMLQFNPLTNLEHYYLFDGSEQKIYTDKKQTIYIPLVESYRIEGQVLVIRDPNSSEGTVHVEGIRITATADNGEVYSTLTDNAGNYLLHVPNGDKYHVKISNILNSHFTLATDEMIVQFANSKSVKADFTYIEKQRGINFENDNLMLKYQRQQEEQK